MEKFRILALTEYSRVFFLDSDIFPKVNLDYIFELSEPESKTTTPAVLRGNLLVAWKLEPCNGGFFMMAPQEGDFEDFQAIIQRRNQEVLTMEYPYWNSTLGWGHVFDPEKDRWIPPKNLPEKFGPNHTIEWSWHGAFGDQGLIYYWSKYFKRDVSIVIEHRVQQWGDCNGEACLKEDSIPILKGNKKLALLGVVHHFTGKTKPWVHDPNVKSEGKEIWFAELDKLEAELKANDAQASNSVVVGLSLRAQVDRLVLQQQDGKATTLGHYPSYRQMYLHVQALAAEGWNPYMNASTDIFLPMVEQ